jgi:hypothetical protein
MSIASIDGRDAVEWMNGTERRRIPSKGGTGSVEAGWYEVVAP